MSALALWEVLLLPALLATTLLAALVLLVDPLLGAPRFATLRHGLYRLLPLQVLFPPAATALGLGLAAPASDALPAAAAPAPSVLPLLAALGAALWAGGTLLSLLRLLGHRRALARLLERGARPAPAAVLREAHAAARRLGLARVPPVVVHPGFSGPALVGLRRPRIVLPERGLDARALESVLLHEMAHARRHDARAQLAFDLLAVLFFFHPLVHVARRRASALREACCDLDVAAVLGPRAGTYRRVLLGLAAERHLPPPAPATAWVSSGRALLYRLELLGDGRRDAALRARRAGRWAAGALGAVLLPLVAVLAAPAPRPAPPSSLEEARALLDRTFTERDRYGCFHRRYAFALWREAAAPESSPRK